MEVFIETLRSRRELHSVECKGPGSKVDLVSGIVKAALGFSNHRDGGRILVGVTEMADGQLVLEGLSKENLTSFKIRDLASHLSTFGSPNMRLDCFSIPFEGKQFLGIRVLPFDGRITICRRSTADNSPVAGKIYVRPQDQRESRPAKADEIENLINMAIEFRLKSEIERLIRAEILCVAPELATARPAIDEYRREAEDF